MKTIKLTADYTTTITREITVDDNFDPHTIDLDNLWYEKGGYVLTLSERQESYANLLLDKVWLVRNDKDKEFFVR